MKASPRLAATVVLVLGLAHCDCGGPLVVGPDSGVEEPRHDAALVDGSAADAPGADVTARDAANPVDTAGADHNGLDVMALDQGTAVDGSANLDATGEGIDTTSHASDAAATLDASLGADVRPPIAGLATPCSNGAGWTLFKFHYGNGSSSAQLDVWDATCDYSFANQACNVVGVWADTLVHGDSALLVEGNGYIRARFSVAGLRFSRAAVYVQARSYATASSTNVRVWSPLAGDAYGGPVDNDWVFDWYGIDWTGYLLPDDDPDLTAIQIYADGGSSSLAVHAVELCVE